MWRRYRHRGQMGHASFFAEHFTVNGVEAARACALTVESLAWLPVRAVA